MSEQLQLRSGSAVSIATFSGAAAELVVDNTNNRLVLQDGVTAGGWPAAKLAEVLTNSSGSANEFIATPNGSAGAPSLRAILTADLPFATGAANLILATPNGSTGAPSLRAITLADLGAANVEQTPLSSSGGVVGPGLTRITTAGITVTLPSTWAYPAMLPVLIKDWTGSPTPSITISSGVNIDGGAEGVQITIPKQLVTLYWAPLLTAWVLG